MAHKCFECIRRQECITVGCVHPLGECIQGGASPPVNRMTDACENITLRDLGTIFPCGTVLKEIIAPTPEGKTILFVPNQITFVLLVLKMSKYLNIVFIKAAHRQSAGEALWTVSYHKWKQITY